MSRRGFALLTVLWVITILGLTVGVTMRIAAAGSGSSRNRIGLARSGWAREACLEILLARFANDISTRRVDTVDLGRGAWCRAALGDTEARMDVNLASPEALGMLVGKDSLVDALLDWRDTDDVARPAGAEAGWYRAAGRRFPRNGPIADVAELRLVRGFSDSVTASLAALLTARGTGRLALNSAPTRLLATLPGFGPEVLEVAARRRQSGEPIQSINQLAALLSAQARETLLAHYGELSRLATTEASGFTAVLEGGVRGAAPVSRAVVYLVPSGPRLAVISQEVE